MPSNSNSLTHGNSCVHVCNQFHPRHTQKWNWVIPLFLTLTSAHSNSPLLICVHPVFKHAQPLFISFLCSIALGLCTIMPFLGPIAPFLYEFLPLSILSTLSRCPKGMIPLPTQTSSPSLSLHSAGKYFCTQVGGRFCLICRATMMASQCNFPSVLMGRQVHVGSLTFGVSEESIAAATKLPRVGDRWFKNHQLLRSSYNRVFKPEFQNISGAKGYSKEWIKEELINPLIVITRLITCEGRYSTFKSCHFRLLAHFQFNKPLNFPFYFLKSLEKMSSQVRKNVTNPHNNLFHHGLIKLLVLAELEKQGKTWDEFIYQFANPHLTIKTSRKTLDLRTISPSKPHSPRTPNPPAQAISLPEKKSKKLVDIPASSSGKKTKKPIVNLHMPSISLDPTPKKLQEVIQQDCWARDMVNLMMIIRSFLAKCVYAFSCFEEF
jgi:hypothetical protein